MLVRGMVMVAGGLALVAGLSACGSVTSGLASAAAGSSVASSPSFSAVTASATTSTLPAVPRTTSRATPTEVRPAKPATVSASAFHAEFTIQSPGLALLTLTNIGKSTVTIQGCETLKWLGADNSPLPVPTHDVEVPGAGPSITLRPGTAAFAGVQYTLGDKANTNTFVATTVQLTPPHGTGVTTVDITGTDGQPVQAPEFDITSVKLGTLQPATQGVLVF